MVMWPVYVPAARLPGATATWMVAGVDWLAAGTVSQVESDLAVQVAGVEEVLLTVSGWVAGAVPLTCALNAIVVCERLSTAGGAVTVSLALMVWGVLLAPSEVRVMEPL